MDNEQERFEDFFRQFYEHELLTAAREGKKALPVDFSQLDKFDPELADKLLSEPERLLPLANSALRELDIPEGLEGFKVRFINLPESATIRIRSLRSEHIGKFIAVEGTVRRASEVRPEISIAIFQCPDCTAKFGVEQKERILQGPAACPECGIKARFDMVDRKLYDSRVITLEEPFETASGERPGEVNISMKEDLTTPEMQRKTDPGNRLKIVGVVKELRRVMKGRMKTQMEMFIEANSIESTDVEWEEVNITPEDEMKIQEFAADPEVYKKLRESLAPSIYGLGEIKDAIILQLFGGVRHLLPDRTKIRGDIHVLLLGDPSTAKSQLLKLTSSIIPRGKYVSGKGATGAGMTATVVKDEELMGGWVLEAGAMVLANKGVICLHPDTNVVINDKIVPIKEVFNENLKFYGKSKISGNIFELNSINHSVISFDISQLSTTLSKAAMIKRNQYNGSIIRLVFNSGFELKVTPEHLLLDGDSIKWKPAKEFSKGDFVAAPLKLHSVKRKKIFIIDLIPDEWKVILSSTEKDKLKRVVIKKYKNLSVFNRKFGLDRNFLSGGVQIALKEFKEIMGNLGLYDNWKTKSLKFARYHGGNRLKLHYITPHFGYLLGFLFGDGHVRQGRRRSRVSVVQSEIHKSYIEKLTECWSKVDTAPKLIRILAKGKIRNRTFNSICYNIYRNNMVLSQVYKNIVGNKLRNILLLPDNVLKAFIAGAMDSDGCISVKTDKRKNRRYKNVHIYFALSKNNETNRNFILALRKLGIYSKLIKGKGVDYVIITGRRDVELLKNTIFSYSEKIKKDLPKRGHLVSSFSEKLPSDIISRICERISQINKTILVKTGVWSTVYSYKHSKYQPSIEQLKKIYHRLKRHLDKELCSEIEAVLNGNLLLDKIIRIEYIPYNSYVYDMYVPKNHNFIADGVFVHNCIDEFDKITIEDQVALHEALEQQTISIAKASIVATLPAQVSVLAGANPKFSRFDPYKSIAEQLTIPDTLLSRFDLKFALRDVPDPVKDEKLAAHIMETRLAPQKVEPLIKPEFLRKYIAYCRKNAHPIMTREAAERLKQFYLTMRGLYSGSNTVAITLRQNEALIRLAEASAKIRLSPTVEVQDAERAINVMQESIKQLGYDYETGKLDVDKLEGGTPASQRTKITMILDLIGKLEKSLGKQVPREELLAAAEDEGINEKDFEELLQRLKREGMIFEPRTGFVQKI